MNVFTVTIGAGERVRTVVPGRFFVLAYAAEPVDVKLWAHDGSVHALAEGVKSRYKAYPGNWADPADHNFDGFDITSPTAQTVTVGVSHAAGDYPVADGDEVAIAKPDTLSSAADQAVSSTAAVIAAANANRRFVHITNLAASLYAARIGDSNVSATRGLELQPGATLTLETTAAVYARSTSCSVSVIEETD